MKTHVIHLDPLDDVVSISDKLSWGKAKRIILVYPYPGKLEIRKIDLIKIQRSAAKKGFSIALVSIPSNLKKLAKELGIPFFRSLNDAQRKNWNYSSKIKIPNKPLLRQSFRKLGTKRKSQQPNWQNSFMIRLVFFSLGVLAIIMVSFLFIPSATIQLNSKEEPQSLVLHVSASDSTKTVNYLGTIPSHKKIIHSSGSQLIQISTRIVLPDKKASGFVEFTNLTSDSIQIPAGTIVTQLDNSMGRFETVNFGQVSSGVGKTLRIPIQAISAGTSGNLAANSIDSLIGDLGLKLTVNNPDPISGGTDRYEIIANENDRNNLYTILENKLRLQAFQHGQATSLAEDVLFTDSIKIDEIIRKDFIPSIDQPGNKLILRLELNYSMESVDYADLIILSTPAFSTILPQGYDEVKGSMKVESILNSETFPDGTTIFDVKFSRSIKRNISATDIINIVQGISIKEAYEILIKRFGDEVTPRIEIKPSWWSRMPFIGLRIDVTN